MRARRGARRRRAPWDRGAGASSTTSPDRESQLAADDEPLDLARALADLEDLRVAVEAADRRLVDETRAAEDLRRVASGVDRGFGRVELRHRRGLLERSPAVLEPRRLVGEQARV